MLGDGFINHRFGITGSSTCGANAPPKCSVFLPWKIIGGRSCGLVWVKGPTPFIG